MSADSVVGENKGEQGAAGKIGSPREAEAEEKEQGTDEAGGERDTPRTRVKGRDGEPLSSEEVVQLLELKKADAAVRAHEQAHLAAAGGLAKGGASFAYQRGPDGRNYAVAGEVRIDTSRGATPEETVAKMARVRAAALAPANPSPQDRKVAQSASVAMSEARLELNLDKRGAKEQVEEEAGQGLAEEKAEGEAVKDEAGQGLGKQPAQMTTRVASLYLAKAGGPGVFHQSA
ncbi:MAG: hypothetical protein HY885_00065 [Deltaproteobacteria bacterium]|nr:hypothetical protein [Deltaproteobacteria bacterium]